jgi:hypothetical protein
MRFESERKGERVSGRTGAQRTKRSELGGVNSPKAMRENSTFKIQNLRLKTETLKH